MPVIPDLPITAGTYDRHVSHGGQVPRIQVEDTLVLEILHEVPTLSEKSVRNIVEALEWRRDSTRDRWTTHILFRYPIIDQSRENFRATDA